MQNLLITGGLGYIGSKFIENFSGSYNIFVLDSYLYDEKNKEKYNLIKKDIRELNSNDIENIDLVIHMAELSNDPLGELSNGLTEEINHAATKNLLEICNEASVKKFIYMSSCAVYGKNDNLVNEMSELSPLTNSTEPTLTSPRRPESYCPEKPVGNLRSLNKMVVWLLSLPLVNNDVALPIPPVGTKKIPGICHKTSVKFT